MAGISNDVSFGARFRLARIKCIAGIQKVEDILIKCGKFSLPSKRRLLEENGLTYTIIDVTEMTVERPKKNKNDVTAEKRSGTHSKVS